MKRNKRLTLGTLIAILCCNVAYAGTQTFFDTPMLAYRASSGDTSDTINSAGYLFTYSRDKWWYPGIMIGPGTPTGRLVMVEWPAGLDAQTITAGPTGVVQQVAASITIKRVDKAVFDLSTFKFKILGNTAGAGASIEVMPQLNGNDAFADPVMFDATGYAGQSFSYNTPQFTGYDTYIISLWMDFALTGLTLVDAGPDVPALSSSLTTSNYVRFSWPAQAPGYILQASPDMTPSHFTNTLAIPVTEGDSQAVYWPMTNSQCLFRLRH